MAEDPTQTLQFESLAKLYFVHPSTGHAWEVMEGLHPLAEMYKQWCKLLFSLFPDPNQHLPADFIRRHSLEVTILPIPLTTAVIQAVNSSRC